MSTHSLRTATAALLCALGLTGFQSFGQNAALAGYKQLGKVTPRNAKEIAASDWSIGCETLDRDLADYSKYKACLGPLGAKSMRLQGGWAKTEKQPGVYDWKWLDEIIDDAVSQGVTPWVELSYGNSAYENGGGTTLGDGLPKSETALQAWDAWVRAMVHRYKDRVHEWEVWNEPDMTSCNITPDDYGVFYVRTARIIREEQPEARIFALGIIGKMDRYAEGFLDNVAAQGRLDLVDAVTFHGYPENPDDISVYLHTKAAIDKHGGKIQPRQGETGAPSTATTGALNQLPWSELTQAKWDLRRMLAHHIHGVPMNLFTLSEFIYNDHRRKGLNTKGLLAINEDKTVKGPKPAYAAAQHVFSIFDATVTPDKGLSATSNAAAPLSIDGYRKQGGGSLVAVWFKGALVSETNDYVPVDFTFEGAKFAHPVYVDLRTGGVFEFPKGAWSNEGSAAKFRAVPVYDSPVLIAEKSAVLFH